MNQDTKKFDEENEEKLEMIEEVAFKYAYL